MFFCKMIQYAQDQNTVRCSLNENIPFIQSNYPATPSCEYVIVLLDELIKTFPNKRLEKLVQKDSDKIVYFE
jgi:hypothetical protein